jgi:1,4-alpha-glucan branching enzyme
MYFVDQCHQNGIGVIVDWVPGHFPKDAHGLARFDGSHLYEHADWRKGEHKGWGTLVFNYGRHEVRNFLIANALFWFDKYHIDGIRVDAVASMLYLDYDREDGEWIPNRYGGNENLEAVDFLRQLHEVIVRLLPRRAGDRRRVYRLGQCLPSHLCRWFGVQLQVEHGLDARHAGLLQPRSHPSPLPPKRITFSIWYAFSENFMLALSHDEVVHGKGSLFQKMPGDDWQKLANLRALFAYMFTHPGKKTLFMGMEFGQFIRRDKDSGEFIVVVCNFTPQPHSHYRVGVPERGYYRELFNSDARDFGGSNMGNLGGKWTDDWSFHSRPYSLDLTLPPLGVLAAEAGSRLHSGG